MKKVFVSHENSTLEFVKKVFYSFQVLIIGIAIPLLFIIGISNSTDQKNTETAAPSVHEVSNLTQLSPKEITGLSDGAI